MFDKREKSEFELTPELAALERQLARLAPAPLNIDRDRLMFAAGQAAARPGRPGYLAGPSWTGQWFWPAATALMTAATVLLSTLLALRPSALVQERSLASSARSAPQANGTELSVVNSGLPRSLIRGPQIPLRQSGYLGIRDTALTRGVAAIDFETLTSNVRAAPSHESPNRPATARELLKELLPDPSSHSHS